MAVHVRVCVDMCVRHVCVYVGVRVPMHACTCFARPLKRGCVSVHVSTSLCSVRIGMRMRACAFMCTCAWIAALVEVSLRAYVGLHVPAY